MSRRLPSLPSANAVDPNVWIVCPCYFDSASFLQLRCDILTTLNHTLPGVQISFVVVDDSAGQDPKVAFLKGLGDVRVTSPPYNLGHQSALVFALRGLAPLLQDDDFIVTMDSDGEDRPQDLPALLEPLLNLPSQLQVVSLACRTYRRQTATFTLMYNCFKLLFLSLTGVMVKSGNFVACRGWLVRDAIFHPHFNLCYSSTWVSLPFHLEKVPLPRGQRYEGQSKMGFLGLVTHGIRMLMPFSEKIAVRGMLLASAGLALSTLYGLACWRCSWTEWPAIFGFFESSLMLGFAVLLFATFAQTKSTNLAGLYQIKPNIGYGLDSARGAGEV